MTQIAHVHNALTGESIERPLTKEELLLVENNRKYVEEKRQLEKEKAEEKLSILKKLGLTEDEAKTLFG